MIANAKLIEKLLEKYTAYRISKDTGISYTTVNDWKSKHTSIYKMQLDNAIKLTEYAIKENIEGEGNKMKKLYLNFKYLKSNTELWRSTTTVNNYVACNNYEELYSIISTFCFTEEDYLKSVYPIDNLFDESNTELDYDDWVETLSENDYKKMCEEFKTENKIKYIEFDVDEEIKYFKQETKDALAKYSDYEQRAIVLNFLDFPYNQIESEVIEMLEDDEVEFATINHPEQFK